MGGTATEARCPSGAHQPTFQRSGAKRGDVAAGQALRLKSATRRIRVSSWFWPTSFLTAAR